MALVGVDPDELSGCVAWGDAADLTAADGAAVTAWPSRVGPSLDSTTGGAAPTYVADAWGGHPAVRFTAGSVLRKVGGLPTGFAASGQGVTLLVLARSRQAVQGAHLLTLTTSTASATRHSLRLTAASTRTTIGGVGRRLDGDTAQTLSGAGTFGWAFLDALSPHGLSLIVDHSGADVVVQQDGVRQSWSTSWLTAGAGSTTTPAVLSLGCAPTTADAGFVGDIFAWAVYDRPLREGEAARVMARWIDRLGLIPPRQAPPVLPWDLDLDAMAASARQTTGCWYAPVPTSRDNEAGRPDVWDRYFVSPDGGQITNQVEKGGIWRDRPVWRDQRPESNWLLLDAINVARGLQACGLDGFATDVISQTAEYGRFWAFNLCHAMAGVLAGFRVPFFLDGAGWTNTHTSSETADIIADFAAYKSGWTLPDGREVIYVFAPELCAEPGQTAIGTVTSPASITSTMRVFFDHVDSALRARGITPAWLFAPVSGWANYADALGDLTWCASAWGNGQPYNSRNAKDVAIAAAANGWKYAQPLKIVDVRPREALAEESGGLEALRVQVQGAIDGAAELVNITTIGDHNEGTAWEPSENVPDGWAPIASWWLSAWKVGSTPRIVRDGVAVIHRRQLIATLPSDTRNTALMSWRPGTAPRDDVEVTTWLTAAGTVEVTVGGVTTAYSAPAGWSVRSVPLRNGSVSARVVRGGREVVQVTSRHTVGVPTVQDLLRYPTLAVSTEAAAVDVPAETPLAVGRMWAGSERRIVTELVRPDGRRVPVVFSRRN